MIFVQFNDDRSEVISYFSSVQEPDNYPSYGEIASNDQRYLRFYNKMPPSIQSGMISPEE